MLERFQTTAIALLIGAAGGSVFYILHAPLPWTLGSLCAAAIVAMTNRPWLLKAPARNFVRPVVGVLAGSSFTAEVAAMMASWWPALVLLVACSFLFLLVGYFYFRILGGFDKVTAFFASAPGGLGEMILVGGSLGGDMRRLVIIHLIRVLLVIFLVPFALQIYLGHPIGRTAPATVHDMMLSVPDWLLLIGCGLAGYFLSLRIRFPGSPMILPMLFSMAVHVSELTAAVPPSWLVAAVQVVLGAVIGARFSGLKLSEVRKVLVVGTGWGVIMLVLSAGAAVIGAAILDMPFENVLLGLAPAGMVEMTLITFALGMQTAFVVTCQLARILFVLLITPLVFRIIGAALPARRE